jgi:hypothetical protein
VAGFYITSFFVANTFQSQPFHKGLAMQADVAFYFMPILFLRLLHHEFAPRSEV